jgi:hypothetical protein
MKPQPIEIIQNKTKTLIFECVDPTDMEFPLYGFTATLVVRESTVTGEVAITVPENRCVVTGNKVSVKILPEDTGELAINREKWRGHYTLTVESPEGDLFAPARGLFIVYK